MTYKELKKMYYIDKEKYEELYQQRFNNEESLKFDFDINGNPAFFVYNKDLVSLLNTIHKCDKKLWDMSRILPDIAKEQFTQACLIEEIHLTNEMEGVASTRKEIEKVMSMVSSNTGDNTRIYGLVRKYMMLTSETQGLNSCNDIRKLYDELVLPDVVEEDKNDVPDGILFRKDRVFVENKRKEIIHEGVKGEENIIKYMEKALNVLNDTDLGAIVSSAIFHYMFGYIHPFYNGNGRMSRYISSKLLAEELHELVAYSLSYTIKKNMNKYYKLFHDANDIKNKGDLTPFVLGYVSIVAEAEMYLVEQLEERMNRLEYYQELMGIGFTGTNLDRTKYILLVNSLFGSKGYSVEELAVLLEVSVPSVRLYLEDIGKDLLKIAKDGRKNLYDINLDKLV